MSIEVEWGSASHVGNVRTSNQDATLAGPSLFVVADGMGGHAAGEVASSITVAMLAKAGETRPLARARVVEAVHEANDQIRERASSDESRAGMGTTIAGLALVDEGGRDHLMAFNVGDSRVYRWHGGSLRQVSVDHSVVAELVRGGEITPEEARRHPSRNVVTRALGVAADVEPDVWLIEPVVGDRYLICSDGLTNEVDEVEIDTALRGTTGAPQATADGLLEAALANGARDNVSVVVVDILERTTPGSGSDDTNPRVDGADVETSRTGSETTLPPADTPPIAGVGGDADPPLITGVPSLTSDSDQPTERLG